MDSDRFRSDRFEKGRKDFDSRFKRGFGRGEGFRGRLPEKQFPFAGGKGGKLVRNRSPKAEGAANLEQGRKKRR